MKIAVAGAGKVGRYLSLNLADRGHALTLIERDADVLTPLVGSDLRLHRGDACSPRVLERAGVRETDVLVAATGDDEDNLVICLLAKQEFAVPRVLGRVNHPTNQWLFDDTWGVDLAVSPPHLLAALVEEEVTAGDLISLLRLEHGQVELLEVRLDDRSAGVGRRVADLELPAGASLLAVVRDGHVTPCRGATPLEEGDEVIALATLEHYEELRRRLIG